MDNKYNQVVQTTTINEHQQQQETLAEQIVNENFNQEPAPSSQSPKVTVSLPKHVASRLRDLVHRRDIALLRLGIISVQFENDQIISLTQNTTNSVIHQNLKQQQLTAPTMELNNVEHTMEDCNAECMDDLSATTITTLTALESPNDSSIVGRTDLESSSEIKTTTASDVRITSTAAASKTMLTNPTQVTTTTPSATTATRASTILPNSKEVDHHPNSLAAVYDDDEDDKDENEVVNEVENQHSSYNIHQLSQLDFADPIELEMYDSENLLFPDYTLNLS